MAAETPKINDELERASLSERILNDMGTPTSTPPRGSFAEKDSEAITDDDDLEKLRKAHDKRQKEILRE